MMTLMARSANLYLQITILTLAFAPALPAQLHEKSSAEMQQNPRVADAELYLAEAVHEEQISLEKCPPGPGVYREDCWGMHRYRNGDLYIGDFYRNKYDGQGTYIYHGDHDGSVKFLQDTYHPHVILSPKDWDLAARQTNPYRHDMDATDGQQLTLGDTTITIYITPGHTGGSLSFLVPVKDHGVPHLAMEWGGTALSANTSKEMLQSYISNAGRLQDIADGAGADVIIGNHTEYNDALTRFERTKARKPSEPNPWVVGKDEVRNYLTVVRECAKSWLAIGEGRP